MEAVVVVGTIFLAALVIGGPVLFLKLRNSNATTIMFERAMELVPVLIHLPPISDDTEVNGRDVRDVVDENISKAQIIYNIIASTSQKSLQTRWYGQRHFAFEIVGVKGFVYLYAAVPADLLDVLKQAVTSAYPSARLEVAPEHNIFNETGGVNGVAGGEFNLKESFAYPIATYQDLKRDALQSILNALSSLEASDGAAIQILFRPADNSWRKHATTHASKKRKGTDKGITAGVLAKDMVKALVKPPEGKEEGSKPPKELSSLEQSVVDAIDNKTQYAGFEVTIRAVASSNILQRSQTIINTIVASFSLFDAPGKNGFKFEPAKDSARLAADYMLRGFTRRKKRNIMNAVELATLFHFPDQSNIPTSQLSRQDSKQVDGPRNMPDDGLMLGFNVFRGVKKPIRLAIKDRQRHMYAVGQTGTGKSTFLENLALQDMLSGNGFAFVDPHGDTVENLLAMVPKERTEDVIYFSPADMDYPMGLNLFEYSNSDQKDFLIQEVIAMLYKLYDPQHQGIMGPRYESIFRNAALAVMADPAGGTFVDIPKLFRDPEFLKQKLTHVKDPNVLDYWQKEYPASQRSNEAGEVTAWFVSKFGAFLSNEMMRNIIGQTKSAFDLRYIMDNKKILLVNLSKGRTGDLNSKLLGMIFVMKFQAAAMSRSDTPEDQRQDFALYVDEFQNFSTDSFATIMSEARKYHLNLIVANQFTTQLTEEIRDAVFGNIGTIVSFRIGQNDVEALGRYFQPTFDGEDLLRVPNHNTIVRTLVNGVPTQPFSMATLPPLGNPNPGLAGALKQLSAAKYGQPRAVVEKTIFERLATRPTEPKPFQSPFGQPTAGPASPAPRPAYGSAPSVPTPAPAGSGSFLDEWLAKQQAQPAVASVTGQAQPSPASAAPVAPAPTIAPPMPAAPVSAIPPAPAPTAPPDLPQISTHAANPMLQQPSEVPGQGEAPGIPTLPEKPEATEVLPINPLIDAAPQSTAVKPDAVSAAAPADGAAASLEEAEDTAQTTEADDGAEGDAGGNVSSAQLDQEEIDHIADELKKDLKSPEAEPAPESANGIEGEVAVEPDEAPKFTPKPLPADPEDTIFIDADGKLQLKDAAEEPKQ